MLKVAKSWTWGCPICGGKRHKRITKKIDRQRERRAWKKEQLNG